MNFRCDIQLDRPSGVYYAGETINGYIVLTLLERALIKGIAFESNGYASSSWLKPRHHDKKKSKRKPQAVRPPHVYGQRVDYFAKVVYFVGSEAALPQLMNVGVYRYDFSVQLPPSCPSSFEGTHGHIRYTLKLLLHRSAEQPAELALERQVQVLQRDETGQQLGPWTAPSEAQCLERTPALKFWQRPLQLHVDIPKAGYEPGDSISVHVKLHNPQQLPLKTLIYRLSMVNSFVGQRKDKPKLLDTQVERRYLITSSHQLERLQRNELLNFEHLQTLHVPQTQPTLGTSACACLQLSYEVEVVVQTRQQQRFIMVQVPIVIAHAPSKHQAMTRSLCDLQAVGVASAPQQTPEPVNLSASVSSLPCDFQEADFMVATNLNKQDKHAMSGEQLDFKPRYLYYQMEQENAEKLL